MLRELSWEQKESLTRCTAAGRTRAKNTLDGEDVESRAHDQPTRSLTSLTKSLTADLAGSTWNARLGLRLVRARAESSVEADWLLAGASSASGSRCSAVRAGQQAGAVHCFSPGAVRGEAGEGRGTPRHSHTNCAYFLVSPFVCNHININKYQWADRHKNQQSISKHTNEQTYAQEHQQNIHKYTVGDEINDWKFVMKFGFGIQIFVQTYH